MKKLLFAVSVVCFSTVATNQLKAQIGIPHSFFTSQDDLAKTFTSASDGGNATANVSGISARAIKEFGKQYKNTTNQHWNVISDGFTAKFTDNEVVNTIYYDTKGRWSGSLKSYPENKMDREIRDIVKSKYYDYNIIVVSEVETLKSQGMPTYVVCLEDKKSVKWLRIYDGDMEVWKEFSK
jgi:hypothetical protein